MFKGTPIIPNPASGRPMPPSGRPKGLGRRNPHCGDFTRKSISTSNGIAIAEGLNKISIFFTGKSNYEPIKKPEFKNPFTKLVDLFTKGKNK